MLQDYQNLNIRAFNLNYIITINILLANQLVEVDSIVFNKLRLLMIVKGMNL